MLADFKIISLLDSAVSLQQAYTIRYDTIRYDSVYLTYSEKLTGSQLSPPHGLCYTSHRASLNVSIHYLAAYKRSTIAILLTYLTQC